MKIPRSTGRWILVGIVIGVLVAGWMLGSPPGRFGLCCFGLTVYDCRPYLFGDLQIRSDGQVRRIEKTHDLLAENVKWLVESKPDVLTVATGWDGLCKVDKAIKTLPDIETRELKSGEAGELYNSLRKAGKRVAIHYHSTC